MQEHRADIWDGSNVIAIMAGSASEDLRYLKSVSLHIWLFGYEVTGGCGSRLCALGSGGCCCAVEAPCGTAAVQQGQAREAACATAECCSLVLPVDASCLQTH
jgi:hypothetical protein